jgi:hypothetical protein
MQAKATNANGKRLADYDEVEELPSKKVKVRLTHTGRACLGSES